MDRFVVFDVETPNEQNTRMSAIGITVVENGRVVDSFASLVNPETYFNPFNIALTGITPEAAEQAPSFGTLWPEIGPMLESGLLIAHNAPFDLGVLGRCLRAYCIDADRYTRYACTVRMSRKLQPNLPDHRLNTLCAYWEIALDHHRADSDSLACAELLIRYLDRGADLSEFIRTYDLKKFHTLKPAEEKALRAEGFLQ